MRDEHANRRHPRTPTAELARRLARELDGAATVSIQEIEDGVSVTITPTNPHARAFGWADFSEEIDVQVGEYGGRWVLDAAPEDVAFLEDIARG